MGVEKRGRGERGYRRISSTREKSERRKEFGACIQYGHFVEMITRPAMSREGVIADNRQPTAYDIDQSVSLREPRIA